MNTKSRSRATLEWKINSRDSVIADVRPHKTHLYSCRNGIVSMPITKCNPDVVHSPAGNYSHLAVVPPGARTLYLAGQLGMHKDGAVPEAVEDQFEQALQNILEIVRSQGGTADHVAKLTFYYAVEPVDRGTTWKGSARNVRGTQAGNDVH